MIPMQTKAIIGVTVIAMTAGISYVKGREHGLAKYHDYKATVETANAVLAEQNAERLRSAEANTAHVAELYSSHGAGIARDYLSRLRKAQRDCAGVPATAGPTAEPDAAAEEPAAGAASYAAICDQTERDAASDALQMLWLQDWVTRVCK